MASVAAQRQDWMALLAKAPAGRLDGLWQASGLEAAYEWLRAPEIGAVMVEGRTGGVGAPFNLGEITVTRCALRLADGAVGHAYVAGRDKRKATQAALCDALMQTGHAATVAERVLAPLAAEAKASAATETAEAAKTKVDFFTMVRGED